MFFIFQWLSRWRAESAVMAQTGVSRGYLRAVVKNCDALMRGEITGKEWIENAQRIAYKFPRESDFIEMLQDEEFHVASEV